MTASEQFPGIRPREYDPELDGVDNELASNYLRVALVKGLRSFDFNTRVSTLADIRIFGAAFQDGFFERHAADIFIRMQDEVDAAAGESDREAVQLGFRSLGKGSIVLHLRPTDPIPPNDEHIIPLSEPSKAELALARVLDLHDSLENGETDQITKVDAALAKRLRQLVASLDDADAGIEVDLSNSDGKRRRSRLSSEGRAFARAYFERRPQTRKVVLAGALRTLSTTGHIEIRIGRRVVEVSGVPIPITEALKGEFNDFVRIRALQTAEVAPPGKSSKVKYSFIEVVGHDEVVPEGDMPDF